MITILLLAAAFSSLLIGAASAAAAAAAAYAGSLFTRRMLLLVSSISIITGALLGREVTITISTRILPTSAQAPVDPTVVILIIAAVLCLAYCYRLPLSTSQIATAAVAGVAIARCSLLWPNFTAIIISWAVLPCLAYTLAFILQQFCYRRILTAVNNGRATSPLRIIILLSTIYLAIASGASNAGNAAGPVVSAGIMSVTTATALSGLFMGIGALFAGNRLLPAMSTDISTLCITRSVLAVISSATILLLASTAGIPSSAVQLSAGSIAGASRLPINGHVRKLATGWLLSVLCAIFLGYVITAWVVL